MGQGHFYSDRTFKPKGFTLVELPAVSKGKANGFTLVELLVVIGIIAILIAMLMPALSRARQVANGVACENNLAQIGQMMLSYADGHGGWLFPPDMGNDAQHIWDPSNMPGYPDTGSATTVHNVWPTAVFGKNSTPGNIFPGSNATAKDTLYWNPPVMLCPADENPVEQHSYVVNSHMAYWNVKYGSVLPGHQSPSDVVLMGEKVSTVGDYYMEIGDFDRIVAEYRHGISYGSNYLMLDMHVTNYLPDAAMQALDPWDFANGKTPPTTAPGGGNGT